MRADAVLRHANAGAAMRLIADAVLEICKREELTTRKRYLSAWGTVEQSGRGWIYRWQSGGMPALLSTGRACITPCLSQDAAWGTVWPRRTKRRRWRKGSPMKRMMLMSLLWCCTVGCAGVSAGVQTDR